MHPATHLKMLNVIFCFAKLKAALSSGVLSSAFQKSSQKFLNKLTELNADFNIFALSSVQAFLFFLTIVGSSLTGFLYSLKQSFSIYSYFFIQFCSSFDKSTSCCLSFSLNRLSSSDMFNFIFQNKAFNLTELILLFKIRKIQFYDFQFHKKLTLCDQVKLYLRKSFINLQIIEKKSKVQEQKMQVNDPQQDLSEALETLQQSLYILFLHYKGFIKTVVLLFFIYVFYKLGSISVKDNALSQKNKLSSLIDRRISVRVQVPKKLQKIRNINILIIVIGVMLSVAFAGCHYIKYFPVVKNSEIILTVLIAAIISALTVVNIYKFVLNKKYRDNDSLQRVISKKLAEFQVTLGPKVIKLLKHHLCRDTTIKLYTSRTVNQCHKNDCKQIRSLYKTRNQSLQALVLDAMNFEWCSICRKRIPFDQYLPFEFKQYQGVENEEQQIKNKLKYLLQGLQRMRKWLSQTSPCNCSKLYWKVSTEKIVEYKQTIKETQTKLKYLENKHKV